MRNNLTALTMKKDSILMLLLLIGMAVLAPLFFKQQLITGTIVNASLIIGVSLLGARDGLLIALIPSSLALATGLLPPILAPMVPVIIVGNAVLVLTFAYLSKFNFWVGVIVAGLFKFAVLYGFSTVVIGLLLDKQIAPTVAQMMSWPQLFTAISGGIVAFGILKLAKKQTLDSKQ